MRKKLDRQNEKAGTSLLLHGINIFLIGLYYFIQWPNSAFDIQLHDHYFVIAISHFWILFSLVCFGNACIYILSGKILKTPLNKVLGILHLVLLIIGTLWLFSLMSAFTRISTIEDYGIISARFTFLLFSLLMIHLLLPINIFFTFFKNRRL